MFTIFHRDGQNYIISNETVDADSPTELGEKVRDFVAARMFNDLDSLVVVGFKTKKHGKESDHLLRPPKRS